MITECLMPSLSPTMEEGTIVSWKVAPGDKVSPGMVMAEVQTDKTVVEWEALDAGVLAELVIPEGDVAKVNMVAALLSSQPGEDLGDAVAKAQATNQALLGGGATSEPEPAAAPAPAAPAPAAVPAPTPVAVSSTPAPAPTPTPVVVSTPAPAATPVVGGRRVSPVAARLAQANAVPLDQLAGTGPDGRIIKRDVEAYLSSPQAATNKPVTNPFLGAGQLTIEDIPLTPMRKVIGQRLLESKQQIPHFYVEESVNAGPLMSLRQQLNSNEGVKVTVNDLIVKATALVLVRHPAVNATFHGDRIRRYGSADISIAVAIPDGLITPIVQAAESLTLSQIGAKVRDLAKRAASNQLAPDEYTGGSFTISNLGMFGIAAFQAIVNPPQAAILAVAGIKAEPVVVDGAVVPGQVMRLTLSCDHRVVDGADAAAFMKDLRLMLENPASLML